MKMLGNKRNKLSAVYTIEYLSIVISKDIPALPRAEAIRIKRAIEERLMVDSIGFGKPLRYSLKGLRRLRVGDYRIVYCIKDKKVIISAIKHRKEIYEDA